VISARKKRKIKDQEVTVQKNKKGNLELKEKLLDE
jgi:hypothetical protein